MPVRILVGIAGLASLAAYCEGRYFAPEDPVLHFDVLDHFTGRIAEAPPGRPLVLPGPDGVLGTEDDFPIPLLRGDVDLVVRAGTSELVGPIPTGPSSVQALAANNGLGSEVDFVVRAVPGWQTSPFDQPVEWSPSLEGNPVLVLAFADFDGDGRIGPSARDAIALDDEAEAAELVPVGMQMVSLENARASGRLRLLAGGPSARPFRIALTAIAFTGGTEPGFLGGVVPTGPALMTAMPFIPPNDRREIVDAGPAGPEPATPDRPLGLEIRHAFDPAPSDPVWGGELDLALDGTETSIDVVEVVSGPATHFGVAVSARNADYLQLDRRPVRLGLDDIGSSHPYEIAGRIHVADDGGDSEVALQIVPLDPLGSITDLPAPASVTLSTSGNVAIRWPDLDGDPFRETIVVSSAAGTPVVLDDRGGPHDDRLTDRLVLTSSGGGSQVDLVSPDPDVDDSGTVDAADAQAIALRTGLSVGDLVFEDRHDVDGNGRIERADELAAQARIGSTVSVP
ncbi:MAG: hypothetical protein IPK00_24745 [Deltaproteobacteria bacterium]|nr:hypothetical protein [Deltaproteobacteria bacterium]